MDDTLCYPVWPSVAELLAHNDDGPELDWDLPIESEVVPGEEY